MISYNLMEMSINQESLKEELEELKEKARLIRRKLPKKAKKQTLPKAISDDEFNSLIGSLGNKDIMKETKVAFLLAYEVGLRISEVKNLKPENIDIKAKRIFIEQGKYSKDRIVPLPKTWRSWMLNKLPIKKSVRSLERNFKSAAKKAGLRNDLVFHSLRHSFATHCIEKGMPINQLQLFLGHSNVATTNVYIRANPIDALASYERLF